jgi:drug/metabolite transporter (DMT)-like permease
VVLSWEGHGVRLNSGALLIAGACLAWGIDNNLTRKLSSADPLLIAMTKGLVAGAMNAALAFLRDSALPSADTSGGAAVVGFLGVGVSLALFILALRHLGTARTVAYFSLAPFIGALVAITLLRDPLSAKLILSGALMGFGLWMHIAERHEHEHKHDALEHEHSHCHDEPCDRLASSSVSCSAPKKVNHEMARRDFQNGGSQNRAQNRMRRAERRGGMKP